MKILFAAMLALASLCGRAAAQAVSYPQRPITIVVTAAAGGVTDVTARALGQGLTRAWGQPVIVENKGGGPTSSAPRPSPRPRPTAIR